MPCGDCYLESRADALALSSTQLSALPKFRSKEVFPAKQSFKKSEKYLQNVPIKELDLIRVKYTAVNMIPQIFARVTELILTVKVYFKYFQVFNGYFSRRGCSFPPRKPSPKPKQNFSL